MPVLKSTASDAKPLAFSMRDIEKQAAELLWNARKQGELMLAKARAEAEVIRKQAHEHGFEQGRQQGLRQGREEGTDIGRREALEEKRAELTSLFQAIRSILHQLEQSRQELLVSAANDVVRLAVAIARRVVRRVAEQPAVLTDTLEAALKHVVGHNDVRIVIHPSQRALLLDSLKSLQLQWPALKHAELIGDSAIAPGGARILTSHGEVDATLDGMIDRIAAEIAA
ncbi:MAG: FliH/SctL family protein [Phycisphaerae bacterium]|nr:FliH/SctL family protein [Phycisphaerae bacterium]MDW8261608.1 FliH/SctL family protein [Phycisphaerales bacterium]